VAQLRGALNEHITPDDLNEMSTALLTQAKAGDIARCKRLHPYLGGLAPTVCEPDSIELQELKRKTKTPEQIRLEKHRAQYE
jgi:hypothetical protein